MKNTYLFIVLLAGFFASSTKAQNLVPNPSFEQYDTCPDYANQVYHCLGWENWLTSPDYFNVCAPCCAVSIPYNLSNLNSNFQIPHSGNAYMGYFNYWSRSQIYIWPWIREILGCQLIQPLQIGVTYSFGMFVNLAKWGPYSPCGTNKFGVKFTTQSFAAYGNQNLSPLVDNTASLYFDTLITDTANWVLLTGIFTADSAYQYLGIGNFFDDFHTDSLITGTSALCYSYYFVDDVSLTVLTSINEIESNKLKIFPIPMEDLATIELPDKNVISEIKIYNSFGSNVTDQFEFIRNQSGYNVLINYAASGIYLVNIFQKGNYYSQKIIIN